MLNALAHGAELGLDLRSVDHSFDHHLQKEYGLTIAWIVGIGIGKRPRELDGY